MIQNKIDKILRTNLEELWFIIVFALPKDSNSGAAEL